MVAIRHAFKGLYRLCECPGKDGNGCKVMIPVVMKNRNKFQKYAYSHHEMGKIGRLSANYKNGIVKTNKRGYDRILRPHHKYADKRGYVYLHRYLKELDLGYYITSEYDVHHIDKNPRNNSPENLQVLLKQDHAKEHNPVKDHSNTICSNCMSSVTYIKPNGRPHWYIYQNKPLCRKCYDKLITIPKRKQGLFHYGN
ncbi:MAG: HNH endonuclease [Candidatus Nitrosocosmicus sp.]|nr:HNH endonuclease [Candidatus Nitrosocosmicus sp.]